MNYSTDETKDSVKKHDKPQAKFRSEGRLRNKPCLCGSGKKFKHCHWALFNTTKETAEIKPPTCYQD